MENTKVILANQLRELRVKHGLTQIDLAKRLNYSDKAISKWERAESAPDAAVLVQLADLFEVSLDELIRARKPAVPEDSAAQSDKNIQHKLILGMCLLLVTLIATFVFVVLMLISPTPRYEWLVFVYAVPVMLVVWLVLNTIWFSHRLNYLIISLLMWTVLLAVYLSFFPFGQNIWLIFLLGVPGQIIILLWSGLRPIKRRKAR